MPHNDDRVVLEMIKSKLFYYVFIELTEKISS